MSGEIRNAELSRGEQQSQIETYPAFGVVFRGRYNGKDVAIKVLKVQSESEYFRLESWKDEVANLKSLSHSNVARFLGTAEDGQWVTVQEWVEGQDLSQVLRGHSGGATTSFAGKIGAQVAEGLQYLHSKDVLHLALSPGNIIVSDSGIVKLKDYGLRQYKLAAHKDYPTHGNPRYLAVEVIMREHDKIGKHSDVWSWASIMWEIVMAKRPFKEYLPPQVARKVWEANDRPDSDDVADPTLRSLVDRCWSTNGSSRPSVGDLISAARQLQSSSSKGNKAPPKLGSGGGTYTPESTSVSSAASSGTDAGLEDMLADLDNFEVN